MGVRETHCSNHFSLCVSHCAVTLCFSGPHANYISVKLTRKIIPRNQQEDLSCREAWKGGQEGRPGGEAGVQEWKRDFIFIVFSCGWFDLKKKNVIYYLSHIQILNNLV